MTQHADCLSALTFAVTNMKPMFGEEAGIVNRE